MSKWVGLEGLDDRTSGSLIPDTLRQMEKDDEFQLTGGHRFERISCEPTKPAESVISTLPGSASC